MQTQKNLLTLGLASLGAISIASPSEAARRAVNDVKEVNITAEGTATRIIITGSQAFTPEVKSFGRPGVTTITLPGVWQAGKTGVQTIRKNGVAFVRYGQYATRPSQQVRIVANYASKQRTPLKYELVSSQDKTRWEVVLYGPGLEPTERLTAQLRPTELPSPAVTSLGTRPAPFRVALVAQRDPIPTFPVGSYPSKRPNISVDTHALVAAATRVASSIPFAPMSKASAESYSLLAAPRLSLASILTITPRAQPLVTAVSMTSKLKPYPVRVSEPKAHLLTVLEKPVTLPQALKAPVSTPVDPKKQEAPPIVVSAVAPKGTSETKTEEAKPSAPKASLQENPLDRVVKLDFVNADLTDVLKLIQVQAKVNVVSGQSAVSKKVTLSLEKAPLRDALDWITRLSGVAYTLEGSNTIIVGTGQEIALLKRTNQTPEAISANIPFFYADAGSLKDALTASFPNITLHIIKASEESKKPEESARQGVPPGDGTPARPASLPQIGSDSISAMTTLKPRGGSIYVVGTRSIIEELRSTVEDMERGLIEIAQRDADRKSEKMRAYVNDVYEVKYVDPTQAARLVLESVPNVIIRPGPSQRFIASPVGLGGSLGQPGGGQGGMGGGQGGMGGGQGGMGGGQGGMGGGQGGMGGGQGGMGQGGMGMGGSNLIESRVLMITGKAQDVASAKEMLSKLDTKVPQFIYEARLVEVNKDDINQLGLKYDLGRAIQIGENDNGGAPNTTVNTVDGGRKLNGGSIFRTPYSVATQIDALATRGKANILARPTLSALDGNPAITFIGDQIPYVISQSIGVNGGLNVQTGIASAGIRLQVSGRSNGDGTMTIYVHPEISSITQFVGGLPQISTRFVDTTIRVKNGETIAIGGLVQKQDIDNMRKIPGLGDLPVLGQLFRSSDKRTKETEVLIFITCSLSKD